MELSLVLCSDAFIQDLNKEYRGKDTPTDVLSFEVEDGVPGYYLKVLGDLVISLDTAKRQAEERRYVAFYLPLHAAPLLLFTLFRISRRTIYHCDNVSTQGEHEVLSSSLLWCSLQHSQIKTCCEDTLPLWVVFWHNSNNLALCCMFKHIATRKLVSLLKRTTLERQSLSDVRWNDLVTL